MHSHTIAHPAERIMDLFKTAEHDELDLRKSEEHDGPVLFTFVSNMQYRRMAKTTGITSKPLTHIRDRAQLRKIKSAVAFDDSESDPENDTGGLMSIYGESIYDEPSPWLLQDVNKMLGFDITQPQSNTSCRGEVLARCTKATLGYFDRVNASDKPLRTDLENVRDYVKGARSRFVPLLSIFPPGDGPDLFYSVPCQDLVAFVNHRIGFDITKPQSNPECKELVYKYCNTQTLFYFLGLPDLCPVEPQLNKEDATTNQRKSIKLCKVREEALMALKLKMLASRRRQNADKRLRAFRKRYRYRRLRAFRKSYAEKMEQKLLQATAAYAADVKLGLSSLAGRDARSTAPPEAAESLSKPPRAWIHRVRDARRARARLGAPVHVFKREPFCLVGEQLHKITQAQISAQLFS